MKSKLLGVCGVLVASLVGCASQQTVSGEGGATAEEQVMARAQARWDAARAGEFEKSFSFTPPSYRAVTDLKVYRQETAGSQGLVAAKVIGVKCESEMSCAAKIRIEYYGPASISNPKPDIIINHYDEPWIKEDGAWWFFKR